jgi:hypothetical protein
MAITLVLYEAISESGSDGALLYAAERKVTRYDAAGDPVYDIQVYAAGEVWRTRRQSRARRGNWEELPGEYASPEKAKEALEGR